MLFSQNIDLDVVGWIRIRSITLGFPLVSSELGSLTLAKPSV